MSRQLASIAILISLSMIAMGQHSSSQCSSANGSQEECNFRHISDKLEQISALDRKIDNAVQHMSEQIQCGTEQTHSNSDFSCPEALDNAATDASLPENCLDLYNDGHRTSGTYTVYEPFAISPFRSNHRRAITVYCDMEAADGGPGWMLFQRRQDGSVSFNRTWAEYRSGFGDIAGEHWLGNDNLAIITNAATPYELRVDLEDWEGEQRYAKYSSFAVQPERLYYMLSLGSYTGDAGDALTYHNNRNFSTPDMDNDGYSSLHCAQDRYWAGWWYYTCAYAPLNNPYHNSSDAGSYQGIVWYHWHRQYYSLKHVLMKIRPVIS